MLPGSGELIPDQPKAQQPGVERVFLIGGLGLPPAGACLVQRLGGDGKAELDISLDLACMERPVEQAELHSALLEHGVKVQAVVPAAVIMATPAARVVIPDPLHPIPSSVLGFFWLSSSRKRSSTFWQYWLSRATDTFRAL